jgi:hypothetical protein
VVFNGMDERDLSIPQSINFEDLSIILKVSVNLAWNLHQRSVSLRAELASKATLVAAEV